MVEWQIYSLCICPQKIISNDQVDFRVRPDSLKNLQGTGRYTTFSTYRFTTLGARNFQCDDFSSTWISIFWVLVKLSLTFLKLGHIHNQQQERWEVYCRLLASTTSEPGRGFPSSTPAASSTSRLLCPHKSFSKIVERMPWKSQIVHPYRNQKSTNIDHQHWLESTLWQTRITNCSWLTQQEELLTVTA